MRVFVSMRGSLQAGLVVAGVAAALLAPVSSALPEVRSGGGYKAHVPGDARSDVERRQPAGGYRVGSSDRKPRRTRYEGTVVGDRRSEVILRVSRKEGRLPRFYMEANFMVQCDDGSRERGAGFIDSPEQYFRTVSRFHSTQSDVDLDYGVESDFEVKGRVLRSGRVRGWLSDVEKGLDPPGTRPNCATDGRLRWRAEPID
jgi:hypothetical protein